VITRLGEGFDANETPTLKPGPMARSAAVLQSFLATTREYGISSPCVVATGVVRKASNRNEFLAGVAKQLGHEVRLISGQEEAEFTEKGVLSALKLEDNRLVIFDLGGGSTEFINTDKEESAYLSIELGAVMLQETYLKTDPPTDEELWQMSYHIDDICKTKLNSLMGSARHFRLVGTGGTAVALAAVIHGIGEDDLNETTVNGLTIGRSDVGHLFERLRGMPACKRLDLIGIEPGREDVILPGSLMVMKIMDYFWKDEMVVSYSDLLEGILIQHAEGEGNG
jgi:exopolyphosphatase/guanosine-5'-triphosphate,3'-diphosphate pyrophosphatase